MNDIETVDVTTVGRIQNLMVSSERVVEFSCRLTNPSMEAVSELGEALRRGVLDGAELASILRLIASAIEREGGK